MTASSTYMNHTQTFRKQHAVQPCTQGTIGNESTLVDRGYVVSLYCPDFGQRFPWGRLSTLALWRSAHVRMCWLCRVVSRALGESKFTCINTMQLHMWMCTKLHWWGVERRKMHVCRLYYILLYTEIYCIKSKSFFPIKVRAFSSIFFPGIISIIAQNFHHFQIYCIIFTDPCAGDPCRNTGRCVGNIEKFTFTCEGKNRY